MIIYIQTKQNSCLFSKTGDLELLIRVETDDLILTKDALYQLSHRTTDGGRDGVRTHDL